MEPAPSCDLPDQDESGQKGTPAKEAPIVVFPVAAANGWAMYPIRLLEGQHG